MKKHIIDFVLTENIQLHSAYALMKFRPQEGELPEMLPGQFVEVRISDSATTYLRRPISINDWTPGENGTGTAFSSQDQHRASKVRPKRKVPV